MRVLLLRDMCDGNHILYQYGNCKSTIVTTVQLRTHTAETTSDIRIAFCDLSLSLDCHYCTVPTFVLKTSIEDDPYYNFYVSLFIFVFIFHPRRYYDDGGINYRSSFSILFFFFVVVVGVRLVEGGCDVMIVSKQHNGCQDQYFPSTMICLGMWFPPPIVHRHDGSVA